VHQFTTLLKWDMKAYKFLEASPFKRNRHSFKVPSFIFVMDGVFRLMLLKIDHDHSTASFFANSSYTKCTNIICNCRINQ